MEILANKFILDWVEQTAQRTKPDKIVWIDGSDEQLDALRELAVSDGSMIKLNAEKYPNCLRHTP